MRWKKSRMTMAVLAAMAVTPPLWATASTSEEDSVAALRAEVMALRQEYEARIATLEKRISELEGQEEEDELTSLREAAIAAAGGAQATVSTTIPEAPSVGRERNLNRLNPEISATGIILATSSDPGTTEFDAQEFELDIQSALDPFSRTRITLAFEKDEVEVEEGYVLYSSLPGGMELTGGKFRQRWGLLNRLHLHALPQSDYPLVYQTYFGEEGLAQTGVSLDWLLPKLLSSATNISLEITNGENDVAFAGELFGDLSYLGHLKSFWDLSDSTYFEWGLSGIVGKTADGGSSQIWGTEFSYQWRPPSRAKYREIIWRTELMLSQRDDEFDQRQEAWGGYTYLEGLVMQNLYIGARLDRAEDPLTPDFYRWGVLPYITWWQSEYVRLRGEYGYYKNSDNGESDQRFTLQLTFAAGPHKHQTY